MLVVGVGGFLLLPLYTHTLSQAAFGTYVAIKANTELIGYIMYVGLLSSVGRLYFDYRDPEQAAKFINSVLMFFAIVVAIATAIFWRWGDDLWHAVSPATPARPFMWYSLALAAATFVAGLGTVWLRLDNRVGAFALLQIVSAAALAVAAYINLVVLKLALPGLLVALIIGFVPGIAMLVYRLRGALRPVVQRTHISAALGYGWPIAVGYLAYFVLNRFSVLALQRFQNADQIAIFGLAQQLALIIAVVSQSFGKVMQPAVFGAAPADAPAILHRASRLFILLVFATCGAVIMFAREVILVVAPKSYASGLGVLLVLLVASFVYSLGLVSNTALDYHRRPRTSASVSVAGAAMSIVFGLLLVPRYGLMGGAVATLGAYATTTIGGHIMAYRLTHQSYFGQMGALTGVLGALAAGVAWAGWQDLPMPLAVTVKLVLLAVVLAVIFALHAPNRVAQLWQWRRAVRP